MLTKICSYSIGWQVQGHQPNEAKGPHLHWTGISGIEWCTRQLVAVYGDRQYSTAFCLPSPRPCISSSWTYSSKENSPS